MTDLLRGGRDDRRVEGGEVSTSVVDVGVHEMMTSIKDLVPHLEEPWRGRIEVNDGFEGPPGNPYTFPRPTGVAIRDAVGDAVGDAAGSGEKRHVVCRLEEIPPGTVRGYRTGNRRIAVARLDDETFRVVADTCPHQAARLSLGSIERMWVSDTPGTHRQAENRNVLLCPWHGFEFDLETGVTRTCQGDPTSGSRPTAWRLRMARSPSTSRSWGRGG